MMSAKIIVFSLMFFAAAPGVSCNAACSEPPSSSDDAESTSGECLMQNSLLKEKVQVDVLQEDGAADESEAQEEDYSEMQAEDYSEAQEEDSSETQAEDYSETQAEDEASEDGVHEEDDQYDQEPAADVPTCKAKEDCKGEGKDCVAGVCINSGSLKYKWTLATVDFKCDGGGTGKPIVKGKPEIMQCKKACEGIPGCTGFNRGKKGNFEAKCYFFKKCTKDTPKKDLKRNTDFNVYFVSATAEVDVPQVTIVKKNMKVLGLTQGEDTQEAAQEDDQEATQGQEDEQESDQAQAPLTCTAKEDCKAKEGLDCMAGKCIEPSSLKYKWTLATVDFKCEGGAIGKPIVKGKPEIMQCKKECESRPGCTGFNRGKKGNWEAKCWFFKSCTKDTPKKDLKKNTDFNVYFVSATADAPTVKDVPTVVGSTSVKVLG